MTPQPPKVPPTLQSHMLPPNRWSSEKKDK